MSTWLHRKNKMYNFYKLTVMKKVENNFAVTGFIGKDAEIRQFTTASVARFSLAVSRTDKGEDGQEGTRKSAFMNMEAWRKNDSASFELLKKGQMITVEGYMKPEEWTGPDGIKRNRIIFVATKFYEPVEKPEQKDKPKGKSKSKKAA